MFVYYINVPVNDAGIAEFENYDDVMENVKTFELTKDEYEYLRKPGGLFQVYDERFGTLIDVCEEERIENENLKEALRFAYKIFDKCKSEIAEIALRKVIDSLKCAIQADSFWEIDIYLE